MPIFNTFANTFAKALVLSALALSSVLVMAQPAAASVQMKLCWHYQHSTTQHEVKLVPNPDQDMKHVLRFTDMPDAPEGLVIVEPCIRVGKPTPPPTVFYFSDDDDPLNYLGLFNSGD